MAATAKQRIEEMLRLIQDCVPFQARVARVGDHVYRAGDRFERLYVLRSGYAKLVECSLDGHEQVVAFPLRGDWLGFDGLASGRYRCDAIVTDVSEVWVLRYDDLQRACVPRPELLGVLHRAMSREIVRDRRVLVSLCALPAEARVADFLCGWVRALAERGLRSDCIVLHYTRAEIGSLLGLNLETVSRALSDLARRDLIRFHAHQRRDIEIRDIAALRGLAEEGLQATAVGPGHHRPRPDRMHLPVAALS